MVTSRRGQMKPEESLCNIYRQLIEAGDRCGGIPMFNSSLRKQQTPCKSSQRSVELAKRPASPFSRNMRKFFQRRYTLLCIFGVKFLKLIGRSSYIFSGRGTLYPLAQNQYMQENFLGEFVLHGYMRGLCSHSREYRKTFLRISFCIFATFLGSLRWRTHAALVFAPVQIQEKYLADYYVLLLCQRFPT